MFGGGDEDYQHRRVVLPELRWKRTIIVFAFLVPILFAAFTRHAWEDYFITLRSSRNLVEGHGLVFNPGERVHTFTSPLGVLLPALCTAIAGANHEEVALWLFRLINAALLAAAAALLWKRADTLRLGLLGRFLLFGLLLTDAKLTDFAINGMETAILVFFVLLLWSELEAPAAPRIGRIAAAVAGLMWTRPDAFIIGGALLLPQLLIRGGDKNRTRLHWPGIWRGGLLGGLLYLPWFAWAWWYYGSPVPHTIVAKSAFTIPVHLSAWLNLPLQTLRGQSMLIDLFLPANWVFGGWPSSMQYVAHALTGIAAFAWIAPGFPAAARRVSLTLFFGMFYLCSIILFPWYVPPWTVIACLALSFAIDHLYQQLVAGRRKFLAAICRTTCVVAVLAQLTLLLGVAWQMRAQQAFVETGVRRQVGEWLRQNSQAGDTVFLEPLGYVGYFSQLKTYDFPGLSSPEVVDVVRHSNKRYVDIIDQLNPTWVLLRPIEAARSEFQQKPVLERYELVKSWNALPQLDTIAYLPGRPWMEFEAQYLLFHRKPAKLAP
jgi:hypothetical protein